MVPEDAQHHARRGARSKAPTSSRSTRPIPTVRKLIDIARKLEGTNRNAGTHAAGVVIANGPITDYVPVQRVIRKGDDAGSRGDEPVITTQWVMGDLEKVGMLKMDFLGLRTLTVLDNAVKLIEQDRAATRSTCDKLPLDDPKTYELLQRGDAKGVFQLESDGIRELLKRMKPDNIRDIIAINALYRPGPLGGGMVDAYVNRKHGREKPTYPHPVMEEILTETYGVMVYQEQIMRILNRLGGIELASAYACIKAISKKKQDIIDAAQGRVRQGRAGTRRQREDGRGDLRPDREVRGYGFNKSHTAAYAQIGYQTAYLKAHYTAEFMAALLSSEIDDGNKRDIMVEHIADARKLGVEVLPPDVNDGEAELHRRGRQDRLRPDRHQGPRPRRRRGDRAGAQGRRAVQGPLRFLRAHRPHHGAQGRHRKAHQGRRLRPPGRRSRQLMDALPRAHGRRRPDAA